MSMNMVLNNIKSQFFSPEISNSNSERARSESTVAASNASLSAENSKEELGAHVAGNLAKDKNRNKAVSVPSALLKKRVNDIKKIQDLTDILNAEESINGLAKKIKERSDNSENLTEFLHQQLQENVEPALIYTAIHKAGVDKDGTIKPNFSRLADDFSTEHGVRNAIHTSLNVAPALTGKIKDPEVASSLRKLIHEQNQYGRGPTDILAGILDYVGSEKYDTLLKAYRDALIQDLAHTHPSADESYLFETSSRLSNIASTKSLLDLCEDMLPKLNKILDKETPPCEKIKLAKATCTLIVSSGSENYAGNIDRVASKLVGSMNASKKADCVNCLTSMALRLPVSFWNEDSLKDEMISMLKKYVGQRSNNTFDVALKHRDVIS
jgi:hypothetical protein